MPATICEAGERIARSAVPRRRADPLRDRGAGRALPRAVAALALRLRDLPGQLSDDAQTIRFIRKGRMVELSDVAADDAAPRLPPRDRGRDAAPRKAAARAIAAPARWRSAGCARDAWSTSRSMPASSCSGRSTAASWSTVEDLAAPDGTLHPVQAAMVEKHGSQCGFCTPGFVMSAVHPVPGTERPVTAAGGQRLDRRQPLPLHRLPADRRGRARGLRRSRASDRFAAAAERHDGPPRLPRRQRGPLHRRRDRFFAAPASARQRSPTSTSSIPTATIVAGATDVGLWITKQLRDLPKIIHVGRVRGFDDDRGHRLRAADRRRRDLRPVEPHLRAHRPRPRRTAAPARLEAGARQRHRGRQRRQRLADRRHAAGADRARRDARAAQGQASVRSMPVEDFFIDYGKQDREPGELVDRPRRAEARRRTRSSAATRSPSASTRTSPR